MFLWLRRKLGLEAIQDRLIAHYNANIGVQRTTKAELTRLHSSLQVQSLILARLVGKLDPQYIRDPLDLAYRAESDTIGESVLAKIRSEFASSFPSTSNLP